MKTVWEKIKLAIREIGNALTNVLCPLVSAVAAIMELFQLPADAIKVVKKIEYWCWYACGTKDTIDKIVEEIDSKIEGK